MNAIDPCYEIREREQASKKQQVIELLAPFRHANDLVASLLLSFDLAGFLVSTGFLIRYANRWTAPLLSLPIALFITRLFIIGHDCCHGSFFSRSKVNAVFGQLTMLPALVPYSPWAVGTTRCITVTPACAAAILHGNLFPLASTSRCRRPNGSFTGSAARFRGLPFTGYGNFG